MPTFRLKLRPVRPVGLARRALLAWGVIALLPWMGRTVVSPASAEAPVASRTLTLPPFTRIVLRDAGTVHVTQGLSHHVSLSAAADVLPRLTAEIVGDALVLGMKPGNVQTSAPILFHVTIAHPEALSLAGSGRMESGPLRARRLQVDLAGTGEIRLTSVYANELTTRITGSGRVRVADGQVQNQVIALDSSGEYAAPGLATSHTSVAVNGSGMAEVAASRRLDIAVPGSGLVRYHGQPEVRSQIDGAGIVQHVSD